MLLLVDVRIGYIVWIAVYRGSSGSRGYRVSFVVSVAVGGKGVVEVCLGGRGGIAVVVAVVVVVGMNVAEALDGTRVDVSEVVEGVEAVEGVEVVEGVVIVLGINVKGGRGGCA
jgi:hypothetical protein